MPWRTSPVGAGASCGSMRSGVTGSKPDRVKAGVAGKRHRLIGHNGKYIRQNRGTKVMSEADAKTIRSYLPYGL